MSESLLSVKPGENKNIFSSIDFGDFDGTIQYKWSTRDGTVLDTNRRYSTFSAETEGKYEITLELNVGSETVSNTVSILVSNDNVAPIIELPSEDNVFLYKPCEGIKGLLNSACTEKQPLSLDASGSYDPNGDEVTYQWELKSQPEGSSLSTDDIKGRMFAFATMDIFDSAEP